MDNCGLDVVLYDCVTTGGTCCGAECYDNMKFNLLGNGSLTTPNQPGLCLNSSDSTMNLVPCSSAMSWQYTANKEVSDDLGYSHRIDLTRAVTAALC